MGFIPEMERAEINCQVLSFKLMLLCLLTYVKTIDDGNAAKQQIVGFYFLDHKLCFNKKVMCLPIGLHTGTLCLQDCGFCQGQSV